jgi:hypothetical protein
MLEIIQNNKNIPFLKYVVKDHAIIKEEILNNIKKMGKFSLIEENLINIQKISNTDWHLNESFIRHYRDYLNNIFKDINEYINNLYASNTKLSVTNYWFQQYEKGDYHDWHIHNSSIFSCVYYVDIQENTPKTTFKLFDKSEIEIKMNEGEILIFPSFLEHISKLNKSDKTKTIISFNIN